MQKTRSEEEVARLLGLMDAEALRASQRLASCDPDIRSALHHAYSMGYRLGWLQHIDGQVAPADANPFSGPAIEAFIRRTRDLRIHQDPF